MKEWLPHGRRVEAIICFQNICGYGGIGRRGGFRSRWATVQVQVLLAADREKILKPALKNQWFDEELSGAIQKLERIYLPFLIWFFGLGGVAAIGVDSFSGIMWIVALLSWTAIDIFLISPLLYLIFVPKPVRKHIKDIHHLTPYEERVRERQLQENPRLDKLMKKYKNMSRISADDEEEGDTP